ncbi:class I SAM-dependent methyltransferase [Legionella qingyii]|uniref:class I SAM-dependent methyltransferase n=1 Tax=Legionella qingyii TaxID=2184757 RepID=UPI000F8F3362|nr:class I SAM-dependent methyltransferase [Legionella qingyii]RUR29354.1 class I SAM-dependent methyltransferase [Legionella qingyii]
MNNELLIAYKNSQREIWGLFAPLDMMTTVTAPTLVKFSQLQAGDSVLDVGCGTGVVAITAARMGAIVSGLDLSPQLLEYADRNKTLAKVDVDFKQADVEALPYADESFDVVLSQFGHMFAPNAQLAIDEMLRVLKPGGIIAFSTWPPEHFVGRLFALVSKYNPPPVAIDSPSNWGSPDVVKNRLGNKVKEVIFDYDAMYFPTLSLAHYRRTVEKTLGPVVTFVEQSKNDSEALRNFRAEVDKLAEQYFMDNKIHQCFLMTRAIKL